MLALLIYQIMISLFNNRQNLSSHTLASSRSRGHAQVMKNLHKSFEDHTTTKYP